MPVTIKRKKRSADDILKKKKKKKSDLFQKTEFDISCKLSPVCMKCQTLFSKKKKKKIKLLSVEFALSVVKVKRGTQYKL